MLKLIGGGFRVGVSRLLVTRALAEHAGVDAKTVAQRLIGYTHIAARPDAAAFARAVAQDTGALANPGHPYPFFLAQPLHADVTTLGDPRDWMVEWKWDGIRAQLVAREGACWLWSRGEELVTERFPELEALGRRLPRRHGARRRDRRVEGRSRAAVRAAADAHRPQGSRAKILAETPVVLLAYDLLERHGRRPARAPAGRAPRAARSASSHDVDDPRLRLSPLIELPSWEAYAALREESRARGVEGFMLKRRDARYGVGRTKNDGAWWKWKIDPMSVDAVLVYAQRGHGRRASLYSDYTFAVWAEDAEGRRLVPFAKAYSGLTDEEIAQVDAVVRKNDGREIRPGAQRHADAGVRARLRGDPALAAAQVRHRGALSAHAALAHRQAGRRGRHAGVAADAGRRLRRRFALVRCSPARTRTAASCHRPAAAPPIACAATGEVSSASRSSYCHHNMRAVSAVPIRKEEAVSVTLSFSINGKVGNRRGRLAHAAGRIHPQRSGAHRDARRLRHRPVRRVHGTDRRQGGQELATCSRSRPRAPRSRPSRASPPPTATLHPDAGCVQELPRPAMRLLHAGHGAGAHRRWSERSSESPTRRDPRSARRQLLPLHRLSQHRQGGAQGAAAIAEINHGPPDDLAASANRVRRKEDVRFLTGAGQYTDDVTLPNQILRVFPALAARAREDQVDQDRRGEGKAAPGVLAVYTGADIPDAVGGLPCGWLITGTDGKPMKEPQAPDPRAGQGALRGRRRWPSSWPTSSRAGEGRRRDDRGRLRGAARGGRSCATR